MKRIDTERAYTHERDRPNTRPPESRETKPDFEAFAKNVMQAWPEGGLDGFELQEMAHRHRLLRLEKYDPAKHDNEVADYWGVEPGDDWFVPNYGYRSYGND